MNDEPSFLVRTGSCGLLTSRQLKQRGWTPALIRSVLGPADHTEVRQRGIGRNGQPVNRSVALYLSERIVQAEGSERFIQIRMRAELRQEAATKAMHTRAHHQRQQVTRFERVPLPVIAPHPEALTPTQVWQRHVGDYHHWRNQSDHLLKGLSEATRLRADCHAYQRYWGAVSSLYGLLELVPTSLRRGSPSGVAGRAARRTHPGRWVE